MQKNMRPVRARDKRVSKKASTLASKPKPTNVDGPKIEPILTNPASWTPGFCFKMAELSREDKNPLLPHVWTKRGHCIAHQARERRKHPYAGMPVNAAGQTIELDAADISIIDKLASLGIHA